MSLKSIAKSIAQVLGPVALVFVLLLVLSVHPIPQAVRNMHVVERELHHAHAQFSQSHASRVVSVTLGDGTNILVNQTREFQGYRLTLAAGDAPASFGLTAEAIVFGRTGLLSFFIDQTGVMRAENEPGRIPRAWSRVRKF